MRQVRKHLTIRGRVQGVFFRASMREEARRLGVSGWVANLPDGSVEALVEGDEPEVAALVEWSRSGPPGARVDGVEIRDEEPRGSFSGFNIAR